MSRYALIGLALLAPFLGWTVAALADPPPAASETKKATLARVDVDDDFAEGAAASGGLFEDVRPKLHSIVARLDQAAKDEKVSGVVLEVSESGLGLGKVAELRAAIGRVRQAGKKVYAKILSAEAPDYLVASACDQIILPQSGSLTISGLRAEVTFYKGLFDLAGVQADFIQIGDFKGAAEPYTRTGMSPEFRQQYESIIEDYYQQMVRTIADDRKLDAEQVRKLIDEGLFTAQAALDARLIDRVAYADELAGWLKSELRADELAVVDDYGVKKADADLSGIGGFLKMMELMMGAEQGRRRASKNPKIAVIYAVGEITDGQSGVSLLGGVTVGSEALIKAFETAAKDDTVKAIVLRVDSPGGSALASDLVWREVTRSSKPVIASMGDVAASGGYYISMGAKKIFAEPGTLTGSIGVVSGKLATKGLLSKFGVTTEVISRGRNSGVLSSSEPFTPSEREACLRAMTEVYKQFTAKAAQGRKLDPARLESLAQGRVFSGRMAVANGLVDALGTLHDAVVEAKNLAGLKAEDKVELLTLPEPPSLFEALLSGPSLGARARQLAPGLSERLAELATLQRLFARPAVTVLPYRVRIR